MNRAQRLAGTLLLLSAGTAAGLFALELAARVYYSGLRPGGAGELALYTINDPVLGWRNKPGASLTFNRREYKTSVLINSLGFRDVERSVTKPPGGTRILVLGDSFVEAYAVERDEGVTRRIEAIANENGCPADVVNAGVHAYTIDQEFLWYERESAPLTPDVVVMAVYYNDILNTLRERYWGSPKPVLDIRGRDLVPVNTPLPLPKADDAGVANSGPAARPRVGSALRYFVIERLLSGAPRFYARLAARGWVGAYESETVPEEMLVYKTVRRQLEDVDRAWERTRDILAAFSKTARARNATPVIAYVPARFEVIDADWDMTNLKYSMNPSAWDRRGVAKRLAALSSEAGIPFLNLTDDLKASVGWLSGSPYFQYDGHWNALGNDVAARSTVDFLRKNSLLRCGG